MNTHKNIIRKAAISLLLFALYILPLYSQNISSAELKEAIDGVVSAAGCDVSVAVVSAARYDALYSYEPDVKLIPASITKLVTSATAIVKLGTGFQFKTVIYTDDFKMSNGVINGNIYIKGFGDPDFNSDDLAKLSSEIAKLGIKSILGNMIYDESYLDDNYRGLTNGFRSDTDPQYWPYVSALNIDKNTGIKNPAFYTANALVNALSDAGIEFKGIIVQGIVPQGAKELVRKQRSLMSVINNMNKQSDNHSAITLFKVLGAELKSAPGTLAKGEEAVNDFLTSIGVSRSDFSIYEGSGLTRFNQVTSNLYIQLLKYFYDRVDDFDTFYKSLPVGGVDGTLRNRMKGTEAEKNVHAKTGTLNRVSSLTGYAVDRDNELIMFYINMNNFSNDAAKQRKRQDQICDYLCRFSRN
ncbi:MAG TPA: D-alanyl-D-alanine carboxypeptidase/D-alanyl-D-alanine-endopeptidase [Ignavibacteria bacterium]|nr:D-alanyl-D-alanine carboxypeptidase/D-alanyl-D-alanine-endopeptidase [Ignavibacteria bacterium]